MGVPATLVGYDRPEVTEQALALGIIDRVGHSAAEAVADADLVVMATPVHASLGLLAAIAPHLKPAAWVTDVGSVKAIVAQHAREVLPETVTFVPGHPMAGAAAGGLQHAHGLLFENATYVLCPDASLRPFEQKIAPLISLIEATGARVLLMEAERHDAIAAQVSHLPQLLAVLLMEATAHLHESDDAYLRLAAGGFRDMTRIANSPFPMWRDILAGNHPTLLDTLANFAAALQRLRHRLIEEDYEAIGASFDAARAARNRIPRDTKGFLAPLSDVFVYTDDRPGALLALTQCLFEAGLDVKDLELLKLREGTGGTFRISFASDQEAKTAVAALKQLGCQAYQLQG